MSGPSYEKPHWYRGYRIYRNVPAAREWRWVYHHDSYDGPGDPRRGDARTIEEAMAEIDALVDEGDEK